MPSLNSIELFAGAGGLALGSEAAGFKHSAVIEWNSDACKTLRKNKELGVAGAANWEIVEGDVRAYDFSKHRGKTDFVIGGPPCQPFSLGGKHLGQDDSRNMFPEAVRAVREIAPKAFIFENVKGLLRRGFANYYSYIILQLKHPMVVRREGEDWTSHLARLEKRATGGRISCLKYNVIYQLLDAADYGVPQRRERVFIVGVRSDLNFEFSFPKATNSYDGLLYDKWISGEYWDRHKIPMSQRPEMPLSLGNRIEFLKAVPRKDILPAWRTVRDAISDLPKLSPGQTSSKIANHFLNPGARSYPGHTGSPWDEPSKALKAGDHGVPGGENTLRLDDGSVRYFSVRECARIQTFPDDWILEGSWTESMRQLGNAVPMKLGNVVAGRLASVVAGKEKAGIKPLAETLRSARRFAGISVPR